MLIQFKKTITEFTFVHAAVLGALLPSCAFAQAPVKEVQVGARDIVDFEFDWGRNGVQCPTCNFGAGNSRLAYIDDAGNLWVGSVDYNTGRFAPENGKGILVDSRGVTPGTIGNGPEWMASQRGSELVYTRWMDDRPKDDVRFLSIGHAAFDVNAGTWAVQSIDGTNGYMLPVGSTVVADPIPLIHYQNFSKRDTDVYWRPATTGANPTQVDLNSSNADISRRWVPGTRQIILTYAALPAANASAAEVYRQAYLFTPSNGSLEQLTFEPQSKNWAFMWQAPEYNNEYVFFVAVGSVALHVYRRIEQPDGTFVWTVINKIAMPKATPFLSSPEPFVHNGKSWIFFTLSSMPQNPDLLVSSHVAMTGIVPGDTIRVLTADDGTQRLRRDPEHFVTAKGPYLYYNRSVVTPGNAVVHEGVYRVDTQLGPRNP